MGESLVVSRLQYMAATTKYALTFVAIVLLYGFLSVTAEEEGGRRGVLSGALDLSAAGIASSNRAGNDESMYELGGSTSSFSISNAENARLRREISELKQKVARGGTPSNPSRHEVQDLGATEARYFKNPLTMAKNAAKRAAKATAAVVKSAGKAVSSLKLYNPFKTGIQMNQKRIELLLKRITGKVPQVTDRKNFKMLGFGFKLRLKELELQHSKIHRSKGVPEDLFRQACREKLQYSSLNAQEGIKVAFNLRGLIPSKQDWVCFASA